MESPSSSVLLKDAKLSEGSAKCSTKECVVLAEVVSELVPLLSLSICVKEEAEVSELVIVGDAVAVRLVVVLSTVVVVGMDAVSDTLEAVAIELICPRSAQSLLLLFAAQVFETHLAQLCCCGRSKKGRQLICILRRVTAD